MQLPFTKEQFFDLLAAYNAGLWPATLRGYAMRDFTVQDDRLNPCQSA